MGGLDGRVSKEGEGGGWIARGRNSDGDVRNTLRDLVDRVSLDELRDLCGVVSRGIVQRFGAWVGAPCRWRRSGPRRAA